MLCLHFWLWSRLCDFDLDSDFLWFFLILLLVALLICMSVLALSPFFLYIAVLFLSSLAHGRAMTSGFPQERNYSKVSGAWRSSMVDIPISVWQLFLTIGYFLRLNFVFIALSYSFACWFVLYLLAQVRNYIFHLFTLLSSLFGPCRETFRTFEAFDKLKQVN